MSQQQTPAFSDRVRSCAADWRHKATAVPASVQLNIAVLIVMGIGIGLIIGQIVAVGHGRNFAEAEEPRSPRNDTAVSNQTTAVSNHTTTVTPPTLPPVKKPKPSCPKGYELLLKHKILWNACVARSCYSPLHGNRTAFRNCTDLPSDFRTCAKVHTPRSGYTVDEDGAVTIVRTKARFDWGQYWVIADDTLVTCGSGGWNTAEVTLTCTLHTIDFRDYVQLADGSLKVHFWPTTIPSGFYTAAQNSAAVTVCRAVHPSIETCVLYPLGPPQMPFTIAPNEDLLAHIDEPAADVVYPAGEYMISADNPNMAAACVHPPAEMKTELTQLMYACIAAVSAFFLFLALLAHLFFPHLNYHAKALLCHTFSLMVAYICMSIQWFVAYENSIFESATPRLILFSLQYIFGLSAFFWLNVLAFDLWKVFANMEGSFTTGQGKKRAFIFKCAYAFGIPVWLCALTLYIGLNRNAQNSLKIKFPLSELIWFNGTVPLFIFFYTPIIIILIENMVFFILTILNFRNTTKSVSIINKKVGRQLFKVCLKLVVIMGLCWIMEIAAWLAQYRVSNQKAWYFTDVINLLQGVFIFLIYVVKRKTLKWIGDAIGCPKNKILPQSTRNTKLSTDTMTEGRKTSVEIIPIPLT